MAIACITALSGCRKEEPIEEHPEGTAQADVIPRLREFISRAEHFQDSRDGDPISLDSAEWYIEGALNYSMSQAWTEYNEQAVDSIELCMPASATEADAGDAASAYAQLQIVFAGLVTEGNSHLIVADVELGEPANGSVNVLVVVDIGSGYERYDGLITSYGPNAYFGYGGWGIDIPNCGCGPNLNGAGECSDRQINHRINQTIGRPAECFFTDVESRYVNVNAQDHPTYWVAQDFPTGIPATPYMIYFCQNAYLCETCFAPDVLSFYTQSTYDVMNMLRPSGKQVVSANIVGLQTLEQLDLTRYLHQASYRYGVQNCCR